MKIRTGFVSNSSSSSFIVLPKSEDVKLGEEFGFKTNLVSDSGLPAWVAKLVENLAVFFDQKTKYITLVDFLDDYNFDSYYEDYYANENSDYVVKFPTFGETDFDTYSTNKKQAISEVIQSKLGLAVVNVFIQYRFGLEGSKEFKFKSISPDMMVGIGWASHDESEDPMEAYIASGVDMDLPRLRIYCDGRY